jgi:hypothetical protein
MDLTGQESVETACDDTSRAKMSTVMLLALRLSANRRERQQGPNGDKVSLLPAHDVDKNTEVPRAIIVIPAVG